MSDISYEQMKVLFENLADRIDKTGGDKATQDALDRVQKVMNDTLKSVEKMTRQGTADSKAIQKVLNDFVVEFSRNAPRQAASTGPRQPHRPYSQYSGYRRPGIQTRNHTPAHNQPDNRSGDTYIRRKKAEQDNDLRGIHDHAKAQGESTNSIMRLKKGVDSLYGGISGFMGKIKSDGFLSAVTGGGVAGAALGLAGERADAYRTMIASGEGQFSSIQQMNNSANDAIMSVQDLAKAMIEGQGATGARQLGGSDYAKLTAAFTKNNAQMANLGLSFEQSQGMIQSYLDLQKTQGTIRNRTAEDMAAGIAKIKLSSEESAHILGITRDDALKAARDQAADPLANAIFKSKGFSADKIGDINMNASTLEQEGAGFADIFKSGAMGSGMPATEMGRRQMQLDPESTDLIMKAGAAQAAGQKVDMLALTAQLKTLNNKNTGALGQQAMMARYGPNSVMADSITAKAQSSVVLANANATKGVDKLGDAGTRAALKLEGVNRSAENAIRGLEDLAMNSTMNAHGKQLEGMVDGVRNGLNTTNSGLRTLQGFPQTVAVITESLLGLAAVVGTASVVFKGIAGVKNIASILGGGANAAGAAGGGGSFIARLLGRGAGAAGGAGGAGGAAGAGMLGPAALVLGGLAVGAGGAYAGNRIIGNRSGESFFGSGDKEKGFVGSRSNGYLTSILGGAGGGALVGSAFGGVGAIPGAVIGGALGLGSALYSDWDNITGKGAANASNDPRTQTALQQQMAKQDAAADATGNRTPGMLSPYQMNQRLMEASERAAGLLQSIKDNSDQQVGLLREELGLTRSYGERMSRLLEETSRNTRQIAEHSA